MTKKVMAVRASRRSGLTSFLKSCAKTVAFINVFDLIKITFDFSSNIHFYFSYI